MNATAAPAEIFPVFRSYNGLTRNNIAALFTRAALVIRDQGYTSYPDYQGETGTDIEGALKTAAEAFIWSAYKRGPRQGEVHDLADELETRLGGVLFVAGAATYGTADSAVCNFQTEAAEGKCTSWAKHRTAADMIAILNLAAQLTCMLPGSVDET
jgi:hypothetical protein